MYSDLPHIVYDKLEWFVYVREYNHDCIHHFEAFNGENILTMMHTQLIAHREFLETLEFAYHD